MLSFDRLSKTYADGTHALSAIDLTVGRGEIVALLGGSGCGKTTLLRLVAGLDRPSEGAIRLDGEIVAEPRADVGVIFQEPRLFPWLCVAENVGFGLSHLSAFEREGLVTNALVRVGLAGHEKRWPRELSGGQQQRVAVARALVVEPQVLLLDEPLSNLDARLRRRVRTEIRELQQRLGFTAVYVTHDQDEALAVSDRIIVMKDGGIAQQGAPRELYDTPASAFIADFMGEANVMPCDVIGIDGESAMISVEGLRHRVAGRSVKPGPAQLAVRPNAITLTPKTADAPFHGRITHSAYLGDHVEYEVQTGAGSLFVVDATVDAALPPHTDVTISFKDRGIAVIGG